jgi:hypothetical protein
MQFREIPYLRMYRPQPNFQTEIIGKIIFLEYISGVEIWIMNIIFLKWSVKLFRM